MKIQDVNSSTDYDKYLVELDDYMIDQGFRKYRQNHKGSDFVYWKVYDESYQIGVLVYDFRKYGLSDTNVHLDFECMPIDFDGRCDLCVNMDIELEDFEKMAEAFYSSMKKFMK